MNEKRKTSFTFFAVDRLENKKTNNNAERAFSLFRSVDVVMHELARALLLLPTFLLVLTHFILLFLRLDHYITLSYYVIGTPAFVGYAGGILIFGILGTMWPNVRLYDRMLDIALAVIFMGALITQLLLARKFQADMQITYLQALLALMIALFVGFCIAGAGLIVKRHQRLQENSVNRLYATATAPMRQRVIFVRRKMY